MKDFYLDLLKDPNPKSFDKEFVQLFEGPRSKVGYMLDTVPSIVLSSIKPRVDKLASDFSKGVPYVNHLAGQIDKEYELVLRDLAWSKYLESLVEKYLDVSTIGKFLVENTNGQPELSLDTPSWVNFQKKYEYNPPHWHSGLISWVLWYDVPYTIENERNYGPGYAKQTLNFNGHFAFLYPAGESIIDHSIPVDKTWNGTIAMFPANLVHEVYPFYTSDDYRITISGNIMLKGLQNK